MKKKQIMEQELVAPEQPDGWRLTGTVKKIGNRMHFIGDIYHDGEYRARIAVNKDDYTVYDADTGRWGRQSPHYSARDTVMQNISWRTMECDSRTRQKIRFFTKSKGNPGEALEDKIKNIWLAKDREKTGRKKEKEKADLALTPEIPEGFGEWTETLFEDAGNVMFYKRDTRTQATVRCGVCGTVQRYKTSEYGEPMTILPPKAGNTHICRNCGAAGVYKQAGRVRRDMWTRTAYLFQNTADGGMLIRMFEITREQEQGYKEYYSRKELMRAYLNRFKVKQYYWHIQYSRTDGGYWSSYNPGGWNGSITFKYGEIYPGWRENIRQSGYFRYCDLELYSDISNWGKPMTTDVICILKAYANMPQIELMAKMGLRTLTGTAIRHEGVWNMLNKRAKDAAGFLKIEKHRMKGLGDISGEKLNALQFEKDTGIRLDEKDIEMLEEYGCTAMWKTELKEITKYMSLKKTLNRLRQYAEKEYHDCQSTARIEFYDYLKIREELGYDMTNSVYLHPRSLKAAHQEMVEERERRRNDQHIKQKEKEFPKIAERYNGLCKKYRYEAGGYLIRPAKSAGEIIMEGRLLHHCVGGDSYLSKHNKGTTAILVLRKQQEPETPYITIEIRETEIIQWYGVHDTKPDEEEMQQVIDEYVKYLGKRKKNTKQNRIIAKQVQQSLQRAVV